LALTTDQRQELETQLEGLGAEAIDQLAWVLRNSDRPDALIKAAEAVLDRIGFTKKVQHEVNVDGEMGIEVIHRYPKAEALEIEIDRARQHEQKVIGSDGEG
jgi:hypothetical protein